MPVIFPPQPVYPLAIDSDHTLYLVYNTSETRLVVNNQAWSDEMEIEPVGENELEQWADNGFANIDGELFYYDAVEKDENGKVFKFKRMSRNLGGTKTKFNLAGVWVRGFVIAEHHNQLVDAICQVEKFIGLECTAEQLAACPTDSESLDCRIRRLISEPQCGDDFSCPDINFTFEIEGVDPCEGTTARFNVEISGNFTAYRLDFGDGIFTTQQQSGVHVFPPNAKIDPIVNVSNSNCQIVQAPTERENPVEPPQLLTPEPFFIPIPESPDFPTIIIPDIDIPTTTLELPQILFPCLEAGGLPFPSVIVIDPPFPSVINVVPPIEIPSVIILSPVIPSVIILSPSLPSLIMFGPAPTMIVGFGPAPTMTVNFGPAPTVTFGPAPTVNFGPAPSFSPIEFGPAPSITPVEFGASPTVSIDWGTPPTCSCTVSVVCPSPSPFAARNMFVDDDFLDGFNDTIELEQTSGIGIPSEIRLIAPKIPDVRLIHDIPTKITIDIPNIPDIKITGAEFIPREIRIVSEVKIPTSIDINCSNIPRYITLDASDMPRVVKVEAPLEFPKILVDVSAMPTHIQVTGMPSQIEVVHNIPERIVAQLDITEELKNFQVPLVYQGGPIPIKFTEANIVDDNGQACFRLVPCDPK